jgi:hypothetical protein
MTRPTNVTIPANPVPPWANTRPSVDRYDVDAIDGPILLILPPGPDANPEWARLGLRHNDARRPSAGLHIVVERLGMPFDPRPQRLVDITPELKATVAAGPPPTVTLHAIRYQEPAPVDGDADPATYETSDPVAAGAMLAVTPETISNLATRLNTALALLHRTRESRDLFMSREPRLLERIRNLEADAATAAQEHDKVREGLRQAQADLVGLQGRHERAAIRAQRLYEAARRTIKALGGIAEEGVSDEFIEQAMPAEAAAVAEIAARVPDLEAASERRKEALRQAAAEILDRNAEIERLRAAERRTYEAATARSADWPWEAVRIRDKIAAALEAIDQHLVPPPRLPPGTEKPSSTETPT